ncbi:hypothetical protein GQR58_017864 [Nymphon striatum]|nr:hypothetical protein GQR58_017864 [Nymphon striatum]
MAIVDFDEFMAPKRPDISLQKLLKFTERRSQFPASSFSFVNRFYCLEYGTTLENLTVPLVTAKYTRMSTVKWPSGYLSKYIIRPALIIEAGEYRIWRTLSNTQIFTVKPYLAYLHHYTSCKEFMKGRLSVNLSENRSFMSNFTNKILESDIIRIWREQDDSKETSR